MPFSQYMASKPDKFWKKYWLAGDKKSKYRLNGFPYVGKNELLSANERVSDRVLMQLLRLSLCKGSNVTTVSYSYSLKLANQLKEKQTSLLGTMKKIRREVPLPLRKMKKSFILASFINVGIPL